MKIKNAFKPTRRSSFESKQGEAGYDNARENIDPHIKTKVINSREGTIEKVPVGANDIVNKEYVDKLIVDDHGTAATDMVINVCYGTSATPPAAATTTEGTLYIQYTA